MATQDGWTVDTSLDGDQWSGGPEADASGLWQSGHRTNDWTAEWQSAVRLASGRARLRNQLPRVKSTPGTAERRDCSKSASSSIVILILHMCQFGRELAHRCCG